MRHRQPAGLGRRALHAFPDGDRERGHDALCDRRRSWDSPAPARRVRRAERQHAIYDRLQGSISKDGEFLLGGRGADSTPGMGGSADGRHWTAHACLWAARAIGIPSQQSGCGGSTGPFNHGWWEARRGYRRGKDTHDVNVGTAASSTKIDMPKTSSSTPPMVGLSASQPTMMSTGASGSSTTQSNQARAWS